MPLDTFPDIDLANASPPSGECEADVLEAKFGDGYSQRAANGINNVSDTWNLTTIPITASDCDTVETFLRTKGGYTAFYWTPDGYSSPYKWVCQRWRPRERVRDLPDYFVISMTFKRVFDL